MLSETELTPENIASEINKCMENPYYFATTYLTVLHEPSGITKKFTTGLKEDDFNNYVKISTQGKAE